MAINSAGRFKTLPVSRVAVTLFIGALLTLITVGAIRSQGIGEVTKSCRPERSALPTVGGSPTGLSSSSTTHPGNSTAGQSAAQTGKVGDSTPAVSSAGGSQTDQSLSSTTQPGNNTTGHNAAQSGKGDDTVPAVSSDGCFKALADAAVPFSAFGIVAVLALLLLTYAVSGQHPAMLFASDGGGGFSISKFQFFVWTMVVGYVYALLYAARLAATGNPQFLTSVPANVLLVMGFSVSTAIAAKAITVNYLSQGRLTQQTAGQGNQGASSLITSDDIPDLNKIQMLFWTLVATIIFIIQAHNSIPQIVACDSTSPNCFPNIDNTLMLLMGISQASYIGGKLTTTNAPVIQSISPAAISTAALVAPPAGTQPPVVNIVGSNFGDAQNDSLVLVNDSPLWASNKPTWSDGKIAFTMPSAKLDGSRWTPGTCSINVQVGGVKGQAQNLSLS